MKGSRLTPLAFVLACLLSGAGVAARGQETQPPPEKDERLASILARVGEGVGRYHRGMFRIAFTETHRREELKDDLTPNRPGRDPVRELLFGHPDLVAVEILTTPTSAAIVAARH